MSLRVPIQTSAAGIRHVLVSLPLVPCLIAEQPTKYYLPGDEPPPTRSDISARAWSRFQRRRIAEPA